MKLFRKVPREYFKDGRLAAKMILENGQHDSAWFVKELVQYCLRFAPIDEMETFIRGAKCEWDAAEKRRMDEEHARAIASGIAARIFGSTDQEKITQTGTPLSHKSP